jgi:hypothetical protein
MMSIVLGLLSIALGVSGVWHWWGDCASVLRGLLPLSFVCGGLVAVLAGISSFRK